ncbi:hypothetical protein FACS1894153_3220 [Bacteroidia bacterium]|nr:hypothetical protein FACS1894153_3220 [Bacteroidia bacterium]
MFSEKDYQNFTTQGVDEVIIAEQIQNLKNGFPFSYLVRNAIKDDGVSVFTQNEIDVFLNKYTDLISSKKLVKFVPASGAASRMFKNLVNFRDDFSKTHDENIILSQKYADIKFLFENLQHLGCYDALTKYLSKNNLSLENELLSKHYDIIANYILTEKGLNYTSLPKGLIIFHKYEDFYRTAAEEHLFEGYQYAKNKNIVNIHFTVSPEHKSGFENLIAQVLPNYEKKYGVKYNIEYSIQKPSTDTVALTEDGDIAKDSNGNILFRPGGHGALIYNLQELDADIIFVKNIDNVEKEEFSMPTITYKKIIAAYLIELQNDVFKYLNILENIDISNMNIEKIISEIHNFATQKLGINFKKFNVLSFKEQVSLLFDKLNRPIRVCGMVRNEGEPGGGPFWTKNTNGDISLQIVEKSQIDMANPLQANIVNESNYFNPVDLVLGVKNYKGEKFDLVKYIDKHTGFISEKSYMGKSLKAIELPGLWNGSMADWINIFVEVPGYTFSPVKTFNDLLRKEHCN